jgi:hypothetical protein
MKNNLHKFRIWLLRLLIGKSPVVANVMVDGKVNISGYGGLIFNTGITGGFHVDGPVDKFKRVIQ